MEDSKANVYTDVKVQMDEKFSFFFVLGCDIF